MNMNKKILVLVFLVIFSLMASTFVLANPDNRKHVSIPKHATEVSPGVFSLGKAVYQGEVVEGFMIFRTKNQNANFPSKNSMNRGFDTSSCYGFLATGAKWKTVEPWLVNPLNTKGLDETFILNNLEFDINKWESAARKNILGSGSITTDTLVADTAAPDNKNEVYFTDINYPGAIAVTIIWEVFSGPINQRRLIEWDQVYDDVDFNWSATVEPGKMNFENIATHELGHSVGMNDLYDARCSEQTMYGYATNGETKKITLESGDIRGINLLY